ATEEREGDHHQPVGAAAQGAADLREVERAGPSIEERDAEEDEEGADGVEHREVERALQGGRVLGLVAAEREGRRAHQLEEDEEVEEVAGEAESAQRPEEGEDQDVEVGAEIVE